MKQMTKEELIEYFIEKLGYNQILGKYISIDDIRNKLTSQIQNVIQNKVMVSLIGIMLKTE